MRFFFFRRVARPDSPSRATATRWQLAVDSARPRHAPPPMKRLVGRGNHAPSPARVAWRKQKQAPERRAAQQETPDRPSRAPGAGVQAVVSPNCSLSRAPAETGAATPPVFCYAARCARQQWRTSFLFTRIHLFLVDVNALVLSSRGSCFVTFDQSTRLKSLRYFSNKRREIRNQQDNKNTVWIKWKRPIDFLIFLKI